MLKKIKDKITAISKETIKEEVSLHSSEIIQGATIILLLYICIKMNGKPVNVVVNVHGGASFV